MAAVELDLFDANAALAASSPSSDEENESSMVVRGSGSGTQLVSRSRLLTREDVLTCVSALTDAIATTNGNINLLATSVGSLVTECKSMKEVQQLHTRKIDDMASQLSELQRNQRQVSSVKKSRDLRLLLDFIVNYGMDSVNGVVVAFPVEVEHTLCIVVSIVLLHAALKALCKPQVQGAATAWRRKELHLLLSKLDVVDFKKGTSRSAYYDQFQRLFAVDYKSKSKQYDNYIALDADQFFFAVATARKSSSQLPARVERDVKANLFATALRNVVNTESSTYDEDDGAQQMLDTKMAWGHEVQREVLMLPAVRRFFRRMYELAEQSGEPCAEEMVVPATMWDQASFHFMGLAAIFSNPGKPRMALCADASDGSSDSSNSSSSSEEGEDQGDDDDAFVPPAPRGGKSPRDYAHHPGFGSARTMAVAPPPAKRRKQQKE